VASVWIEIAGGFGTVILTSLAYALLARTRSTASDTGGLRATMRYSRSLFSLALIPPSLCFAASALVVSFETRPELATVLGLVALGVVFSGLALECLIARHDIDERGFASHTLLKRRGHTPWAEVTRVRYWAPSKVFVLDLRDRTTVRLSVLLSGLPTFARAVMLGAPQADIDRPTRLVLDRTARGTLPTFEG